MQAAVTILVLAAMPASVARADFRTIAVDGDTGDWDGITRISDPLGDAIGGPHDIKDIAVANDENNLYFLLSVSDANGDYYGNSSRVEELTIYIDADNDASTGTRVGPEGQQIGAEYSLFSARRIPSGEKNDTSFEGTLYRGDKFAGGALIGNFSNTGLPKGAEAGGVDEVTEFETTVPIFQLAGVNLGDTVALLVRATRSGSDPQQDWLDTAHTYTLAALPAVSLKAAVNR